MHDIMWDSIHHVMTYSFHCTVSLQKVIFIGLHCIYLVRKELQRKKALLQKQQLYSSLDDLNFALENLHSIFHILETAS